MSTISTAIYGGGPFYEGGQAVMDDLRASGFTTVVQWGPQVAANGDLVLNPGPVISNGEYVGYPDWPAQLASLKQGQTSVNRLRFMPGGWGSSVFPNIKALIDSQGTGPDSVLYRNYAALKQAIPTVDGIDFDDESLYDQATTVAFSRMLNALGYEVTFCPYTEMQFWVDCLQILNSETPGLVSGFNLQCYAGGGGNTPGPWIDAIAQAMGPDFPAASMVFPGLWCRNGDGCGDGSCPSDIASQFTGWKSSGIQGGFIWLYDDIQKCAGSGACGAGAAMDTAAYASAIGEGLSTQNAAASPSTGPGYEQEPPVDPPAARKDGQEESGASATMSAIYGGGPFYSGGSAVIDDLKASGFTTVVAWALHVNSAGDLIFNDPTIVSDGAYVGDAGWPGLLAGLKQGQTSVNRLLFSVGGWEAGDFPNIQALIQSQGIGPSSILYRNFAALKQAIPTIDGIDFDDETLYDQATTVQFSQMLHGLGYQVTFCPYANAGFWVDCLYALNTSQTPDLVTGLNLQCYAGGGNNTPQPWIDAIAAKMGRGFPAKSFVFPGLWCRNGDGCSQGSCPSDVESQLAGWKSSGIRGGFIWLYDDLQKCEGSGVCGGPMGSAAYASSIANGLG